MRRRDIRSKKVCYLFTFILKEWLKQILQQIKNRIFAEAVGVFASFVENVFSTIATVRPIEGSFGPTCLFFHAYMEIRM